MLLKYLYAPSPYLAALHARLPGIIWHLHTNTEENETRNSINTVGTSKNFSLLSLPFCQVMVPKDKIGLN